MKYSIRRVSDAGVPLIDIVEAKQYMKVTYASEDALILNLIERVINDMEAYSYASLQASTYKVITDGWWNGCVPIVRGPAYTIDLVEYYGEENTLTTLAADQYFLSAGTPDYCWRAYNISWPSIFRRADAVQITYTTAPTVESKVKLRVLQGVAYMFENRSSLDMPIDKVYQSLVNGMGRKHFLKLT